MAQPHLIEGRFNVLPSQQRIGGTSVVLKARDLETDQEVAVKILELANTSDLLSRRVFEADIRSLRALDHPSVVKYVSSGYLPDGRPYLVTEWLERSLGDALAQQPGGKFRFEEVLYQVALPLAEVLAYAHSLKPHPVEHRDIKVSNIMLRSDLTPVLVDFGFGKTLDARAGDEAAPTAAQSGMYTPNWEVSHPFVTDVFGFGVVLLRCHAGETVKTSSDVRTALDAIKGPIFKDLLERCLSSDPNVQFRSGVELVAAVRHITTRFGVKQGERRRLLPLKLTRAAEEHIALDMPGNASIGQVVRRLTEELADGFHAEYKLSEGQRERGRVRICTRDRILVCAVDEYEGSLTVVSAHGREFSELESMRKRALPFHGELPTHVIAHTSRELPARELSSAAISYLVQSLDEQFAKTSSAQPSKPADSIPYLETLVRGLTVRERLLTRRVSSLPVVSCRREGKLLLVETSADAQENATHLEDEVELVSRDRRTVLASGEVVYNGPEGLLIQPRGRLSDATDAAFVQPSTFASYQAIRRQKLALEALRTGAAVNSGLADVLNDPNVAKVGRSREVTKWFSPDLDQDKRNAVRATMNADSLLVVQGPPGTGKTSLIAEVVQQTLAMNPDARVLLVSQTHVAVDNAVERLARAGVKSMVRLVKQDRDLHPSIESFRIKAQAELWQTRVRQRASEFLETDLAAKGLDRVAVVTSRVIGELRSLLDTQDRLRRQLVRLGGASEEFSTLTIATEVQPDQAEIETDLEAADARFHELVAELLAVKPDWLNVTATSPELVDSNRLRIWQTALVPADAAQDSVEPLIDLQAEWLDRLTTDDSILAEFLRGRSLLAGTAVGFIGQRHVEHLTFDLCIIDEASKATATELLVPISRSRKVLLVGDSHQLPPLSELDGLAGGEALLAEIGITGEQFEQTLFEHLEQTLPQDAKLSLTQQYRMVPGIGDLISHCFYDDALVSVGRKRADGLESFSEPVTWLSTSNFEYDAKEAQQADSFSFHNPAEVAVILRLLNDLEAHLTTSGKSDVIEILVVAPYKAQVRALHRAIDSLAMPHLAIECLTIDQVQGREADAVVFSVVRSNEKRRTGFLNWRRLNVALSRGRSGLFIVGDHKFASETASPLAKVARYVADHPETCTVQEVLHG